jgi:membrane fusion protein, multidrug efflux system
VAAWGDREFPAVVKYVAPALRQQTRDLLVEAVAENKDGALRPGMFATVQLLVGEEEQPTVPAAAVRAEGTTKRLFVARGGQAWEMVVRTGASKDGRVAILEPLGGGDRVIVQPPPGLHDGSAIQ